MTRAAGAGALTILAVALLAMAAADARRRALLGRLGPGVRAASRTFPEVPRWAVVATGAASAWVVGLRLAGGVGSIAGVAIVLAAPKAIERRRARRRDRETQEHLAEAVALVGAAMRSGRSLQQAVELTAGGTDPLAPTFRRLADRTDLGDPMDASIDAWAAEVGGPDARLVAGVLKLHRRTGGSLAASLEDLVGTLRQRRTAARELASLTAQARLSATILGLLPIGFFLFMSVLARRDLEAAYETPAGVAAVGVGLGLQAAAYVWIRLLLRVEP